MRFKKVSTILMLASLLGSYPSVALDRDSKSGVLSGSEVKDVSSQDDKNSAEVVSVALDDDSKLGSSSKSGSESVASRGDKGQVEVAPMSFADLMSRLEIKSKKGEKSNGSVSAKYSIDYLHLKDNVVGGSSDVGISDSQVRFVSSVDAERICEEALERNLGILVSQKISLEDVSDGEVKVVVSVGASFPGSKEEKFDVYSKTLKCGDLLLWLKRGPLSCLTEYNRGSGGIESLEDILRVTSSSSREDIGARGIKEADPLKVENSEKNEMVSSGSRTQEESGGDAGAGTDGVGLESKPGVDSLKVENDEKDEIVSPDSKTQEESGSDTGARTDGVGLESKPGVDSLKVENDEKDEVVSPDSKTQEESGSGPLVSPETKPEADSLKVENDEKDEIVSPDSKTQEESGSGSLVSPESKPEADSMKVENNGKNEIVPPDSKPQEESGNGSLVSPESKPEADSLKVENNEKNEIVSPDSETQEESGSDAGARSDGSVSAPEVKVKNIRHMSDEEVDAVLRSEFPGDTDGMRELRKYIRTHIVN